MPDLHDVLDRAAGNPPDLPDVDRIRRRGDTLRTRRRLRGLTGAMVAAVLVVATVVSVRQPRQQLVPGGRAPVATEQTVTNRCPASGPAPRGGIIYSAMRPDFTTAVLAISPGGGAARCLVDTAGADSAPAWSPDRQWIAFVGGDGTQDDVFMVRPDGSDLRRVTNSPAEERGPVWSPDGERLGYTVTNEVDDTMSIHVVGRDGRADRRVLLGPAEGMVELQDWSPDGRTLLFTRDDTAGGGHIALWTMAPDGTGPKVLRAETRDFGSAARYSPDGTQIAFQADLDGGCIYRSDPLAQRLTRVTTGCDQGGSLSWSPDGTRLVLSGGGHGPEQPRIVTLDGSAPQPLTTDSTAYNVDWAAEGN